MNGGSISGFWEASQRRREAAGVALRFAPVFAFLVWTLIIEISFFSNRRSNLDEVVWGAYDIMQKVDDSRSD